MPILTRKTSGAKGLGHNVLVFRQFAFSDNQVRGRAETADAVFKIHPPSPEAKRSPRMILEKHLQPAGS
jgi:hypothetical protein